MFDAVTTKEVTNLLLSMRHETYGVKWMRPSQKFREDPRTGGIWTPTLLLTDEQKERLIEAPSFDIDMERHSVFLLIDPATENEQRHLAILIFMPGHQSFICGQHRSAANAHYLNLERGFDLAFQLVGVAPSRPGNFVLEALRSVNRPRSPAA